MSRIQTRGEGGREGGIQAAQADGTGKVGTATGQRDEVTIPREKEGPREETLEGDEGCSGKHGGKQTRRPQERNQRSAGNS